MAGRTSAASTGRRIQALALAALLFVATLGIGWLVWSLLEWRNGRTPSYRLLGLRIVRLSDGRPIGLGRSFPRVALCCLLVIPTIAACCLIGLCFVFGASPPDGLLRDPRTAPWDSLTATRVMDERARPGVHADVDHQLLRPIDLTKATRAAGTGHNGQATNT
jgi:hypothetical protein